MATTGFEKIDEGGNEVAGRAAAKTNRMFRELFAKLAGTAAAAFGALTAATSLTLGTGTKTAAATAGAATLNKPSGVITSEALTTAAAAVYTLTLTNSSIASTDVVLASLANGTNSAGDPVIAKVTPGNGSVVITVVNRHASVALNGTLKIAFAAIK